MGRTTFSCVSHTASRFVARSMLEIHATPQTLSSGKPESERLGSTPIFSVKLLLKSWNRQRGAYSNQLLVPDVELVDDVGAGYVELVDTVQPWKAFLK